MTTVREGFDPKGEFISTAKINKAITAINDMNRAMRWCNKNIEEARKNIDQFITKYCDPVDVICIDLNDDELDIVCNKQKNK